VTKSWNWLHGETVIYCGMNKLFCGAQTDPSPFCEIPSSQHDFTPESNWRAQWLKGCFQPTLYNMQNGKPTTYLNLHANVNLLTHNIVQYNYFTHFTHFTHFSYCPLICLAWSFTGWYKMKHADNLLLLPDPQFLWVISSTAGATSCVLGGKLALYRRSCDFHLGHVLN